MNLFGLDASLVALLLAMGCVAGFLAGLLGIGGGMLLVPAMTYVGTRGGFDPSYVVKMAVATSLSTIVFTSISSVRAHHRKGAVRWDLAARLAPGIVVGSVLGALVAKSLPASVLALCFAGFTGYSAVQMLVDRKPKPSRQLPGTAGLSGMGGLIGGLSALVGAGGAFISVPFMVWCNVPIHTAVATSAALGFPIAAAGTLGYWWAGWQLPVAPPGAVGFIYLPALALIACTSVLLAPVGAAAAHRLDRAKLKRVFAVLLFGLASYMVHRAVSL